MGQATLDRPARWFKVEVLDIARGTGDIDQHVNSPLIHPANMMEFQ